MSCFYLSLGMIDFDVMFVNGDVFSIFIITTFFRFYVLFRYFNSVVLKRSAI